jgi:hypothetical protein
MKLTPNQTDEVSLAHFGEEAVALVLNRDFSALAERFGYALAFGRNPAMAIEDDFAQCIAEEQGASSQNSSYIQVKYFEPNSTSLFAVVECFTPITQSATILIELIITGEGETKHITLEQISHVT